MGQDQHPPGRHCALRSLLGEKAILVSASSFSLAPAVAAAGNGHVTLSVGDRQEQPVQLPLQTSGFALHCIATRVIGILSLVCGIYLGIPWGTARDSSPSFAFAPFPLGTCLGTPCSGSALPQPQACWWSSGPQADAPEGLVFSLGLNTVRALSALAPLPEAPPSRECREAPPVCFPCSSPRS